MAQGFDTALTLTPSAITTAKNSGYTYAGRYFFTTSTWKQILTQTEAKNISSAGLFVVSLFQNSGTQKSDFSSLTGAADGDSAFNYAASIGQPKGTPIYFCVDYNAPDADVKGCINDYFQAIAAQSAVKHSGYYTIGVYGNGNVCKYIKDTQNLAQYSMLSCSTSFYGSPEYLTGKTWNIHQYTPAFQINGNNCDPSESSPIGGGGWKI